MDADASGKPGTYEQPTVVELGDVTELTASKPGSLPDAMGADPDTFSPPSDGK